MSSKKIPLSSQTPAVSTKLSPSTSNLTEDKYIWLKILFSGIITALILVFVLFIIALIANFFITGMLLSLFENGLLLVFASAVYFMLSGLSIWFGPSPQWADFKSRMLNMTIKPKNMNTSLQNGFKHIVTAFMLLVFSS